MPLRSMHATIRTLCLAASLGASAGSLAQPSALDVIDVIDVIGATPLGGELDTDRIAANVQTASAAQLREQGALDLADFMKRVERLLPREGK